jgi:hypothetical protein
MKLKSSVFEEVSLPEKCEVSYRLTITSILKTLPHVVPRQRFHGRSFFIIRTSGKNENHRITISQVLKIDVVKNYFSTYGFSSAVRDYENTSPEKIFLRIQ